VSNDGILYIVATPIGHLGDLSQRAIEVLGVVDRVAAEDTRRSGLLLQHLGITKPFTALHDHNERERAPQLVERLLAGERIALVSDAGTPLVSDPGFSLVRAAQEAGIRVVPVPGPSAVMAALSAAGIPTDRFCFEGFLPAKAGARRERLAALVEEARTLVFFEAPHRMAETLAEMVALFGEQREAALARELTKTHETIRRLPLGELAAWVAADGEQQLGEAVLLVRGAAPAATDTLAAEVRRTASILAESLPVKEAAALAARICGAKKNLIYRYLTADRA